MGERLRDIGSTAERHAVLSILEPVYPRSYDMVYAQPAIDQQTATTVLPVQALAQQVTGAIILPLIHAGGQACVQKAQHSSGGRVLTRHDGADAGAGADADAEQGGLEASLLTTLRFLAGMRLCIC